MKTKNLYQVQCKLGIELDEIVANNPSEALYLYNSTDPTIKACSVDLIRSDIDTGGKPGHTSVGVYGLVAIPFDMQSTQDKRIPCKFVSNQLLRPGGLEGVITMTILEASIGGQDKFLYEYTFCDGSTIILDYNYLLLVL